MTTARDQLKNLSEKLDIPIKDLICLSSQNDPYYMGSPAQIRDAKWFAALWLNRQQEQIERGVSLEDQKINLRGFHYYIQATQPDLPLTITWKSKDKATGRVTHHSTDTYINEFACWKYLCVAAKAARYLGYVPPEMFFDAKSGTLTQNVPYAPLPGEYGHVPSSPTTKVSGGWVGEDSEDYYNDDDRYKLPELPSLKSFPMQLPELPKLEAVGYHTDQKYIIEVWVEKSSAGPLLANFCQQNRINLVVGQGELSITTCLEFIKRVQRYNKPVLVLYVSDYDPSGYTMPTSVSRKIEYFIETSEAHDVHVKLAPIVLTKAQIDEMNLPSVPAKNSDSKTKNWNERHGVNTVVELDSLEALHPGSLVSIFKQHINKYTDDAYWDAVYNTKQEAWSLLNSTTSQVHTDYSFEIESVNDKYESLLESWEKAQEEFNNLVAPFQEVIDQHQAQLDDLVTLAKALSENITDELEDVAKGVTLPAQPKHYLPDDNETWLFDSKRSYMEQLEYYKARKSNIDLDLV